MRAKSTTYRRNGYEIRTYPVAAARLWVLSKLFFSFRRAALVDNNIDRSFRSFTATPVYCWRNPSRQCRPLSVLCSPIALSRELEITVNLGEHSVNNFFRMRRIEHY